MSATVHLLTAPPYAQTDQAAATQRAFDHCAPSLYRYFIVRTGGDTYQADDFMQQLWIHARNLTDTPLDQLEFRLRAVARNLLRTHWRKQGVRRAHLPLAAPDLAAELARRLTTEELPLEVLETKEARDQLLLALTALPAAEQELIVEHYFHSRSHADLAEELGVSPRAVEGRLYRARLALREKLQHLEPF